MTYITDKIERAQKFKSLGEGWNRTFVLQSVAPYAWVSSVAHLDALNEKLTKIINRL